MTYSLKPNPKCSTETIKAFAVVYKGYEIGDVLIDGETLTEESANIEAQNLVDICIKEGFV